MVETDEKGGHEYGWMTDEYLRRINIAVGNAERVIKKFGDKYDIIITADHGGHDRGHGLDIKEDMTIPIFMLGKHFKKNKELTGVSILDLAPTICDLFGLHVEREWQGKSRLSHKD